MTTVPTRRPPRSLAGRDGEGTSPGPGLQQSQSVEADDDGGAFVSQHAQRQREVAGEVPDHQGGDEGGGDDQVGDDDPAGSPGEPDDGGNGGQLVADDDRVGRVEGPGGSGPAPGA